MASSMTGADLKKADVSEEVVVGFDPVLLSAPFFLRCGAALIDYLLVLMVPALGLLISRILGNDGSHLIHSDINNIAWLAAFLVGLCNFVLLPIVSGQSIGKMITGLRIVSTTGTSIGFGSLVFRQTIGYLLTLLTGGLGFVLSVFSSKGRSLHDLISGSIVVFGDFRKHT